MSRSKSKIFKLNNVMFSHEGTDIPLTELKIPSLEPRVDYEAPTQTTSLKLSFSGKIDEMSYLSLIAFLTARETENYLAFASTVGVPRHEAVAVLWEEASMAPGQQGSGSPFAAAKRRIESMR